MAGPLQGVRIIEFAGIGPGPFCGMMLADHGAEVIRIERPGGQLPAMDPLSRNRRSIVLNTKTEAGLKAARQLCASADGLIEGYRPGVMEKLGLGPDVLLAENDKLVYGRMTGWGQHGPWSQAAGHDINYISLSGVLHTIGPAGQKPSIPVNYVGDFAGGGMMLAFGMVSAILNVRNGGKGQVIDAAMTDGSAVISSMMWGMKAMGMWKDEHGVNMLDGGAHFYDTYECADGKWISIGSIEPQFYALLLEKTGLTGDPGFTAQHDRGEWGTLKDRTTALFKMKSRDEWCALMDNTDVCFAPVLSMTEAPDHPHNKARNTFVEVGGAIQPAPAPRYSETVTQTPRAAQPAGTDTEALLSELNYSKDEIDAMKASGATA